MNNLFVLFVLVFFAITSCKPASEKAAAPSVKKEAWVTEEVLVQLGEIKAELVAIKKQQAELKALLEKGAVRGGAPVAKAVGSVSLKGTPSPSARVAVVEFTDYQCPFCARHAKTVLPQIRQQFVQPGLVHYEVRDFPLGFHQQAKGAAIAVNCMAKGRYDAMHDWVFSNPGQLNRQAFITQAKTLGAAEKAYTACLDSADSARAVDADIAYGEQLGVSGTPKFFIGKVQGNQLVDVEVISGAADYSRMAAGRPNT